MLVELEAMQLNIPRISPWTPPLEAAMGSSAEMPPSSNDGQSVVFVATRWRRKNPNQHIPPNRGKEKDLQKMPC